MCGPEKLSPRSYRQASRLGPTCDESSDVNVNVAANVNVSVNGERRWDARQDDLGRFPCIVVVGDIVDGGSLAGNDCIEFSSMGSTAG